MAQSSDATSQHPHATRVAHGGVPNVLISMNTNPRTTNRQKRMTIGRLRSEGERLAMV